MSFTETIFALSTLAGKSGVAVVRISGANSLEVAQAFAPKISLKPNQAKLANILSIKDNKLIDKALLLYFKAPHSFTGEDVVELQLHGSIAVIKRVMSELSSLYPLCRLAEPGEFSKRAFLNDKMDLTAAEGLAQLIEAETELQHEMAIRQFAGEQFNIYSDWRGRLISILSVLEAFIDFPEDDVPEAAMNEANLKISSLAEDINNHLLNSVNGEIIYNGIKVAIIGSPNVGKSTLLNLLARRDAAIVSDIAGTTRDVIQVKMDIDGYPFILFDTAGIRESSDAIEIEGINRSKRTLQDADICIWVEDISNVGTSTHLLEVMESSETETLKVYNKLDLQASALQPEDSNSVYVSLKNSEDVTAILSYLSSYAKTHFDLTSHTFIASIRHKSHLNECLAHLRDFSLDHSLEISTEYVRLAANELGKITGVIDVEVILDTIFSTFCIGK